MANASGGIRNEAVLPPKHFEENKRVASHQTVFRTIYYLLMRARKLAESLALLHKKEFG
jgi:hypothetical protein